MHCTLRPSSDWSCHSLGVGVAVVGVGMIGVVVCTAIPLLRPRVCMAAFGLVFATPAAPPVAAASSALPIPVARSDILVFTDTGPTIPSPRVKDRLEPRLSAGLVPESSRTELETETPPPPPLRLPTSHGGEDEADGELDTLLFGRMAMPFVK